MNEPAEDPAPATPEIIKPSHGWVDTVLSVLVAAVAGLFGGVGIVYHVYSGVIIVLVLGGLVSRAVGLYTRDLLTGLVRRPLGPELRWHRVQLAKISVGDPRLEYLLSQQLK